MSLKALGAIDSYHVPSKPEGQLHTKVKYAQTKKASSKTSKVSLI